MIITVMLVSSSIAAFSICCYNSMFYCNYPRLPDAMFNIANR